MRDPLRNVHLHLFVVVEWRDPAQWWWRLPRGCFSRIVGWFGFCIIYQYILQIFICTAIIELFPDCYLCIAGVVMIPLSGWNGLTNEVINPVNDGF